MRTIGIYLYNELSEEAKRKAIENSRYGIAEIADNSDSNDYRFCLAKMEEIFEIKVYDWEVTPYRHFYRFSITSPRWDENGDEPKMLPRYITHAEGKLNNGKYYGKLYRGGQGEWIHKTRYSKVLHESDYSITGSWTDGAAADAIAMAYMHVRQGWTIRDFVGDMLEKFFQAWENDLAYHLEDEFVEEEIISNEVEGIERCPLSPKPLKSQKL